MARKKEGRSSVSPAQSKKKNFLEPRLPGGFRDYAPKQALAKQSILDRARSVFERFGFEFMDTPAVEFTETLTGGEEDAQKIIYNVSSSRAREEKIKEKLSLRFDLTVPLARFVAANPEIPKPFKRYQIGNVWRGERQQKGRYREFTQADVDIIGVSSIEADAEIVRVIYAALRAIGARNFTIRINNRKLLNCLPEFAGFSEDMLWDVLRIIDKRDKIGDAVVYEELAALTDATIAESVKTFLTTPFSEFKMIVKEENDGQRELYGLLRDLEENTPEVRSKVEVNLSLVRGLQYYTGVIFETVLDDNEGIGSVCGGGRYDNLLMEFTGEKIPAVGASFGIDRFIAFLDKTGAGEGNVRIKTQVLIFNLAGDLKSEYERIARQLREAGVNTSLYIGDDRAFQAQLAYAVKKEIQYAVIYGENERKKGMVAVKNLVSGTQEDIAKEAVVDYIKERSLRL